MSREEEQAGLLRRLNETKSGRALMPWIKGANFVQEDWRPVLHRLVQTAEREEHGQVLTNDVAVVAPNLVSGSVPRQDVAVGSGMCTPFSGESSKDSRVGGIEMGSDRGVSGSTTPNPPNAPSQTLPPVLTSQG